jgi:hypothetical protein
VTLAVSTTARTSQAGPLAATVSTVPPFDSGRSRLVATVRIGTAIPGRRPARLPAAPLAMRCDEHRSKTMACAPTSA